jgi:hypothetical protein
MRESDGTISYAVALDVVHSVVDTLCTVQPQDDTMPHGDFASRASALMGAACEVVDITYEYVLAYCVFESELVDGSCTAARL